MKKILFSLIFLLLSFTSLLAKDAKDVNVPITKYDYNVFCGLGSGFNIISSFAMDIGFYYKFIGLDISGTFGNAPADNGNDTYNTSDFLYTTSKSQRYDAGYLSCNLIIVPQLSDNLSVLLLGGYYSHNWVDKTTTSDDQGILDTQTKTSGNGIINSGFSYGIGLEYFATKQFMIGLKYQNMHETFMTVTFGFRF